MVVRVPKYLRKLFSVLQTILYRNTFDKTFTKIPIKNFKRFLKQENNNILLKLNIHAQFTLTIGDIKDHQPFPKYQAVKVIFSQFSINKVKNLD